MRPACRLYDDTITIVFRFTVNVRKWLNLRSQGRLQNLSTVKDVTKRAVIHSLGNDESTAVTCGKQLCSHRFSRLRRSQPSIPGLQPYSICLVFLESQ